MPAAFAIDRVLQWVSPGGVVSSVFTMMASTASSVIVRGAPTRGSSYNPARRCATNWLRHFATVVFVVRRRRATVVSESLAQANTMRARNAMARFTRTRFVRRTKSTRSLSVSTISALGRPIFAHASKDHIGSISPR